MKHNIISRLVVLIIFSLVLSFFFQNCAVTKAGQVSSALYQQGVTDPEKHSLAIKKVNEANFHYQRKNNAEAKRLARESLSVYPTFEAHYLIGTILYHEGHPDESLQEFYKAENLKSSDPQLLLSVAAVLLGKGDTDGALARYQQLIRLYPDDPLYYFRAGAVYKLKKDYNAAYDNFKKAESLADKFPEPAQLYLQLADTASELKKYDESDQYYKKAAEYNPGLAEAKEGISQTQIARILEKGNEALAKRDFPAAEAFFKEAIRQNPKSSAAYLLLGSSYLLSGSTDAAIENLQKSVSLNPASPQGYVLLGSAYHKKKDYAKAAETARSGLRVAPENAALWNALGIAARDSGETALATDSFYRAVKLAPSEGSYRLNLAYAYLDASSFTDAEREFKEALKNPASEEEARKGLSLTEIYILLNRGDRFLEEGRITAAQAEYSKALAKNRNLPAVHSALGRAEFENKKYAAAEKHQQQALAISKDYIPALQELVRIYTATGNRSARAATLKRIESLTGSDVTAALAMGRILEDEGKLTEAREYYLNLLKKQKDPEPVRFRLGYVNYKLALEENKNENFDKALNYLSEASKYNPSIPYLNESLRIITENKNAAPLMPEIKKADALYDRGEYARAAAAFEEIYKKHRRPLILVKLAESYIAMGQEAKGVRLLEEASTEFPGDYEIAEAINNHLLKKGNLDAAHSGFTDIVNRNESAYYSHYKLGIIDLKRNRPAPAVESFTKALIHRPDFTPARIARGVAYYEKRDIEAARKEFEAAKEQKDSGPLPLYNIGILFINEGMRDKAAAVFEGLLKSYPEFTDAHYHLSYIHFSKGDYGTAEAEIKKAISKKSEPMYWNALAQIYEKQSGSDRSVLPKLRETYAAIITGFPDSKYARESRMKMQKVSPDQRFVQPYNVKADAVLPPVLVNGELIYAEKHRLVSLRSDGKNIKWVIHQESPILDFKVNGVVILLTKGNIAFFDAETAEFIHGFRVPPAADSLLGSYHNLAFTEKVRSGRTEISVLKMVDKEGHILTETEGSAGGRFVFSGDTFYEIVPDRQQVKLRSISEGAVRNSAGLPLPSKTTVRDIEVIRGSRGLYLHVKNHGVHILSPDNLEALHFFKTDAEVISLWERNGQEALILKETRGFRIVTDQGKEAAFIKLPAEAERGLSYLPADSESLIYTGKDRKIRRINLKGEVLWTTEIPPAQSSRSGQMRAAWTLYH